MLDYFQVDVYQETVKIWQPVKWIERTNVIMEIVHFDSNEKLTFEQANLRLSELTDKHKLHIFRISKLKN